MLKLVPIDFEYNHSSDETLNMVSCSIRKGSKGESEDFWLHNGHQDRDELVNRINKLHEQGATFLAYNVVAEARSFLSLGLDPLKFRWIDLYLEYRCLCNHNDSYAYGKQLSKGKKRFTKKPKPKWERKNEKDEKNADASKPEYNYGAAAYKTLGVVIDTKFKTASRDLIISAPKRFTEDEKDQIIEYGASDTIHLIPMYKEMLNEYKRLLGTKYNVEELLTEMATRAEYSVRSAKMEKLGYPINYSHTKHFSKQVPNIIWECQHDINSQFDETGDDRIFRNKVKIRPFELSLNESSVRTKIGKWCSDSKWNAKRWTLTDGGKSGVKKTSLSLKAFQKPLSFAHTYPRGHFLAQMQRYLKLKQSLNGFLVGKQNGSKGKKKFWDSVGSDRRVKPYMGIYGAQSARSQPSATGFIPLKAAWMRSLIYPTVGKSICGIDYASQEFLLAALLSGDSEMLKAYDSGDVYLAFGKAIGYIPRSGTKKTHKKERDECKAVVLGLSYDMSEYGLATDLSEKFGRRVSPEEALKWITKHKRAYRTFWKWKDKIQKQYKRDKHIKLPCGWYMFGDNDNFRSIGNVPVQGMGSSIMRKAVQLAQEAGLDVIYTLHDALYIEYDTDNEEAPLILAQCMDAAFRFYFPEEMKGKANVRLDADVWGPDQKEEVVYNESSSYYTSYGAFKLPTKYQNVYIDERAEDEYNKFKKYFKEEKLDFATMEF